MSKTTKEIKFPTLDEDDEGSDGESDEKVDNFQNMTEELDAWGDNSPETDDSLLDDDVEKVFEQTGLIFQSQTKENFKIATEQETKRWKILNSDYAKLVVGLDSVPNKQGVFPSGGVSRSRKIITARFETRAQRIQNLSIESEAYFP